MTLTQKNLLLGHACEKFTLRVFFSSCLNFCQFQPSFAYKSVAYKKSL